MVEINIRVKGGLGNQLFIYAAGLFLAEHHNGKLKIDTTTGFFKDNYSRTFELENYGFVEKQEIQGVFLSILKFIDYKLCIKYQRSIFKFSTEQDLDAAIITALDSSYPNYNFYLDSYYQDIQWVLPVLPVLKRRYKVASRYLKNHKNLTEKKGLKIAVHIRDFEQNYSAGFFRYYQRAIEYFTLKSTHIKFIVFSESPLNETIKRIFAQTNYSVLQPTDDDFFLMGQFDGIITANSTYSWWVAALAYDSDGMVVLPGTKIVSKFGSWDPKSLKLPGSHLIPLN